MVSESNKLLNSRKCFKNLRQCCIVRPMYPIFESFICKAYLGLQDSKIPWTNFCLPDKSPVMAVYVFFLYEYNYEFLNKLMLNRKDFPIKSRRLLTRWYYRVKRFVNEKKEYISLDITKRKPIKEMSKSSQSVLNKRSYGNLTVDNVEEHNRLFPKRVKRSVTRYEVDTNTKLRDDENCSDFDENERVSDMSKSDRSEDSQSAGSLNDFVVNSGESESDKSDSEDNIIEMPDEVDTDEESFDSEKSGWD